MHAPNQTAANLPHALKPLVGVATKSVTIAGTAGTLAGLGSFTWDDKMQYAQVAIETAPVRTDPSGETPTTSLGQPVTAGQVVLLSRAEAILGKWIRSTGVSATAQVSQYTV